MMRWIVSVLLAVALGFTAHAKDPAVDNLVCEITAEPNYDLSRIPAEKREGVIAKLREVAKEKGSSYIIGRVHVSPMDADLQLLRLGDTFTIERMIKDYRAYDSRFSWGYVVTKFERSRQPKIIPYLAEDFSSNEDPNGGVTIDPPPDSGEFAVSVPARSIFSGVTVIRIIEKSPEFIPQMKTWAEQAYALRLKSPERFRKLMQVWWIANKEAFERGNYWAVMPVTEQKAESAAPPGAPSEQRP